MILKSFPSERDYYSAGDGRERRIVNAFGVLGMKHTPGTRRPDMQDYATRLAKLLPIEVIRNQGPKQGLQKMLENLNDASHGYVYITYRPIE